MVKTDVYSQQNVKWHKKFKEDYESVEDDHRDVKLTEIDEIVRNDSPSKYFV